MHAEFGRESIERSQLILMCVVRKSLLGASQNRRRNRSQPTVPHAKSVEGYANERGAFLLRQTGSAS